ncbi:hypothetical protein N7457_005600 [Penicillium paradoxum]|uniref:uncharacterized protein n=1 Tax=Penicillium paradoxum TaxID=176176 RepID=UPI002548B45F|nr:uncharacterized protein N7457_005600 [Penicillium paradoxum]KAJ5780440.1 hypothetical protein N7457_005600 [Penicillium paradoxum]
MARILGSRMTRSQSREASIVANKASNVGSFGKSWLSGLTEEPSTPASGFIVPRQVIPESPENHEGHTNVSGTTLGHNDVEPSDSQAADKIEAHLPFIQQQATFVMTLLVPPGLNPDTLAVEARKLSDSKHPHRKRLRRSIEGLTDELEDSPLSRDGKSFLDISQARRLLSSTQLDAAIPHLHMTNCALLTLNVFLPSMGTKSHSEFIQELDAQFPACTMDSFADDSSSRDIGASITSEATFTLALNIRTQFFIMELDRRQQEHDFSPFSILRQVFAMDLTPNENDSQDSPSSFRGFNLPGILQDDDGHLPEHLPEKFLIAVGDRYNDLQEELSEWDSVDIDGLRKAYRWRSFERDLARWVCTREKEIKDDIRRLSEKQVHNSPGSRRLTSVPAGTPNRRQLSTVPPSTEVRRQTPSVQKTLSPRKERLVNTAPVVDETPEHDVPPPETAPKNVTEQGSPKKVKQPVTNDPSRRKSLSNYRNAASLAALKRRQDTSIQQSFPDAESQGSIISASTSIVDQAGVPGSSADNRPIAAQEIQQSPDLRYPDIGDETTYVNNDEDLDLGQDGESDMVTSTSPPASARIERVSHNPRFFDSPRNADSQRSNKERSAANKTVPAARRFLDKQKNARVVSPISQFDSQGATKHHTVLGKRARVDASPSDESDDEFEEDTHEIDPRRRVEKPTQSLPVAKRQRLQDDAESGLGRWLQSSRNGSGNESSQHQNSTQVGRRAPTVESTDVTDEDVAPEPLAAPPSSQSRWAQANTHAASHNHLTQKAHHRWTDEEDERLIYLMGIWGTSFATIKKQDGSCPATDGGPLLERRSQINCKDRARNLKRKYLREGRPLPPGLDKSTG